MTLRHMKIFQAVCENGFSTTKAAESLLMTQPAVSLAVKELEQYYGTMLFDRIGRRLKITEAGMQFLEYANRISSLFDDMEKGLKNWDSFGLLRVGASMTIGSQFMPGYIRAFYERYPGTEVKVLVAPADVLESKILSNELDLAFIENEAHNEAIVTEEYMEDYLAVICAIDSPFQKGEHISMDTFKKQKLLLREPGSGTREVFDEAIKKAGIQVEPSWESLSSTALINAVINNLGIAVLPYRLVLGAIEKGVVKPIVVEGLDFSRRFHMIHHADKYLTSSAINFMNLCRYYEMDYPMPRY